MRTRAGEDDRDPERGDGSAASVSRLYALLAGAALLLGGVAGFLYEPSFGTGAELRADEILGTFPTNGWDNLLHVLLGLAGLALATRAPGAFALVAGTSLAALGAWALALDPGEAIAGALPVSGSDGALHLLAGAAGVGAWLIDRGGASRPRLGSARPFRESGA